MDKSKIRTEVKRIVKIARKKFGVNFEFPIVDFFSDSTHAGKAFVNENRVAYNDLIAKENGKPFLDAIIHEIAHLISVKLYPKSKQMHGPEWKSIMLVLGAQPNTTHNFSVTSIRGQRKTKRAKYSCKCQDHFVQMRHHKTFVKSNENIVCTDCKGYAKFRSIVDVLI